MDEYESHAEVVEVLSIDSDGFPIINTMTGGVLRAGLDYCRFAGPIPEPEGPTTNCHEVSSKLTLEESDHG